MNKLIEHIIRIVLFYLFLIVSSGTVCAQSVEVISFELANDLDKPSKPIYDLNGAPCALIKVYILNNDIDFEGRIMKKQLKGQNEWWLWVQKDARKLTLKSSYLLPTDIVFREYDIDSLVGNNVYHLKLRMKEPAKDTIVKTVIQEVVVPEKPRKKRSGKLRPEAMAVVLDFKGSVGNIKEENDYGIDGYTNNDIKVKNFGMNLDFSFSYFLVGFGFEGVFNAPKKTTTENLLNYGYTGNFTKTTTTELVGPMIYYLDLGIRFKYFSLSCQVGLSNGDVRRTASYEGWGYGLVDGEVNEYWGSYTQQSINKSTTTTEHHLALSPQIKMYLPGDGVGFTFGLGYTFIPALYYQVGFTFSAGIYFFRK